MPAWQFRPVARIKQKMGESSWDSTKPKAGNPECDPNVLISEYSPNKIRKEGGGGKESTVWSLSSWLKRARKILEKKQQTRKRSWKEIREKGRRAGLTNVRRIELDSN